VAIVEAFARWSEHPPSARSDAGRNETSGC